jgi:hypothetical protein
MKNVTGILLLSWICMATTCVPKESENCHPTIKFSNNSDMTLYVQDVDFYLVDSPDPFDIRKYSYFHPGQRNIKSHTVTKEALFSRSCFEHQFKTINTLYVYVFDAEVVKNTSWDIIARDYLVLKRYDLTLEDLQRLDWKISYPPTEAMKDVEQWPPYESE